jgi:hypothetical protein
MNARDARTQLSLNIAPIKVPNSTIRAAFFRYDEDTGNERLKALRNELRGTHAVTRRSDRIVCLPRIEDAPEVGGDHVDIALRENLDLAGALLNEFLIDHFVAINRPVLAHRPLKFLGSQDHDMVAKGLPPGLAPPHWLSLLPCYELDVRRFFLPKKAPFLGLALDSRTRRRITSSCEELLEKGFNLKGLYVGRIVEKDDPRVEAALEVVGRVASTGGGQVVLDDAREGLQSIPTKNAYVEARGDAFNRLLGDAFSERSDEVRDAIFAATAARRTGPPKLEELRRVVVYLQKQQLAVAPGITVEIDQLLDEKRLPPLDIAPKPIYVLDPTGGRTDTWADRGLQKYGPYSQQTFSKNRPRIAVLCQASTKGRVEQFLQKFFNGQPHPKKNPGPFDNGLIGKYRLEAVSPKFFSVDQPTAEAYRRAAQQAVSEDRWDLALVQIEARFRDFDDTANPYLVTKHVFLTHQTPTQEFTLETANLWDGQLAYALNNMGLAAYSKLGGTPWLLRSDRSIAHELVMGIGSAEVGDGRFGDRQRVVGFTTVFSGDGDYRVANRSRAVPFNQYGSALLDTLEATVEMVSRDMNWQEGSHVRLVFHAFKPFRDIEAEAVKDLMATLGKYDVEYSFVELSESHPFLIFDEAQKGVTDFETRRPKGVFVPQRGQMLKLGDREVLIVLTGPSDVKRPEDGMPSPILLRLHRNSTFTDLTYLSRQVYAFAHHSWRSFFPGSLPVTVQYSELIAGLLGTLGRLPNWNPDVLWGRIGHSRWFL